MRLGATGRDHLVVDLPRQWQVHQPITVDVAHLPPPYRYSVPPKRCGMAFTPGQDITASGSSQPLLVQWSRWLQPAGLCRSFRLPAIDVPERGLAAFRRAIQPSWMGLQSVTGGGERRDIVERRGRSRARPAGGACRFGRSWRGRAWRTSWEAGSSAA